MIRKKYIVIAALSIFTAFTACNTDDEKEADATETPAAEKKVFYGKVTYVSRINTDDTVFAQTMHTFSPTEVELYYSENEFRLIEHGGLSHGDIILYRDKQEAWQLDSAKQIAYLGEYSDLGDPSAALKDLMPDHFAPTVEATDEKETIAGIPCKKYKIVRSGVIPKGDTAFIWVAETIVFPPSRFDIQTEINHVAVPAPILIGFENGAVMRLQASNSRYVRTIEVSELKENYFPEHIFDIPANYQKK